jgi:pyruvate dehydrogenase E2 component (dihydrolipoamide acetyltransferase)
MPTDVIMPQMGESIFEGTITKWLKKPGDTVQRDEPLFEISTDKVDAEIPSPASGVLSEVKIAEGNTVQINTVVGVIADADGQPGSVPPAKEPSPAASSTPAAPPTAPVAPSPAAAPAGTAAPALTDVIMPQMGESIFEGTITKWLKKPGDAVQQDEPLFEISTDKVDAEIPSPAAGVLAEIKVPAGTTVQINAVVAVISVAGAAGALTAPAPTAQPTPVVASPATTEADGETGETGETESGERVRSSPLVQNYQGRHSRLPGQGWCGGGPGQTRPGPRINTHSGARSGGSTRGGQAPSSRACSGGHSRR